MERCERETHDEEKEIDRDREIHRDPENQRLGVRETERQRRRKRGTEKRGEIRDAQREGRQGDAKVKMEIKRGTELKRDRDLKGQKENQREASREETETGRKGDSHKDSAKDRD